MRKRTSVNGCPTYGTENALKLVLARLNIFPLVKQVSLGEEEYNKMYNSFRSIFDFSFALSNVNVSKVLMNNNEQYMIDMIPEYKLIFNYVLNNEDCIPLFIQNTFNTDLSSSDIILNTNSYKIINSQNAGGNSELSEGYSYELLYKLFNAKLLKTEMDIKYWLNNWKKTDYLISINNIKIGVSVTRAIKYKGIYTNEDGKKLLIKKLDGINEASNGVLECDQWKRQILHIWTDQHYINNILLEQFRLLQLYQPKLCSNTIVLVTVAVNSNWLFYQEKKIINNNDNNKNKVNKTTKFLLNHQNYLLEQEKMNQRVRCGFVI